MMAMTMMMVAVGMVVVLLLQDFESAMRKMHTPHMKCIHKLYTKYVCAVWFPYDFLFYYFSFSTSFIIIRPA